MVGLRSSRHAPPSDLPITPADPSADRASPPPTAAVDIDGLVKRYGERTAVDGVSLRVPRARVLALLGPNGAGKTTTIETCDRLPPSRRAARCGSSASIRSSRTPSCARGSA